MSRRHFVTSSLGFIALGLATGCGVPTLPWQRTPAIRRIGFLAGAPPNPSTLPPFQQGLSELGYVEGRDIVIEWRNGDGDDRLAEPAAELVALKPEVIVVPGPSPTRAALAATSDIPIVNSGVGDLVNLGFVESMARPGANLTGMTTPPLAGKQVELLNVVIPALKRLVLLFDPSSPPVPGGDMQTAQDAAGALGIQMELVSIGRGEDLDATMEQVVSLSPQGVCVLGGAAIVRNQARLAELAVALSLPTTWQQSDAVARGGLLSYAINRADLSRRAASFVDKILKGANPAELPLERPTAFDVVVNLITARALGLTIPQSVMAQTTQVIQ